MSKSLKALLLQTKLDDNIEMRILAEEEIENLFEDQQEKIRELQNKVKQYEEINTPEIKDFIVAVEREALHQRERWGNEHDGGKADADWFWLIGYLAGKAIHAKTPEKQLHHIITTAAACLNWHSARVGAYTSMRPGIEPPAPVPSKYDG